MSQNYKFCLSQRVILMMSHWCQFDVSKIINSVLPRVNFKISIWSLFVDLLYILSWQTTKLMSESHQNHDIIWMSYLWHQCDVHFMTQKFGVQILISVWHQPDVTICTCDLPVTCWCESYFKLTQKWCHGASWEDLQDRWLFTGRETDLLRIYFPVWFMAPTCNHFGQRTENKNLKNLPDHKFLARFSTALTPKTKLSESRWNLLVSESIACLSWKLYINRAALGLRFSRQERDSYSIAKHLSQSGPHPHYNVSYSGRKY